MGSDSVAANLKNNAKTFSKHCVIKKIKIPPTFLYIGVEI